MGVQTSEVGYISAMPRREDHEVRQGHVGHWIKKKTKNKFMFLFGFVIRIFKPICHKSLQHNQIYIFISNTTRFGRQRPSSDHHYKAFTTRQNTVRLYSQYLIPQTYIAIFIKMQKLLYEIRKNCHAGSVLARDVRYSSSSCLQLIKRTIN